MINYTSIMFDERTKEYNIVLYTNRDVIIIPISKWKQITEDLNILLESLKPKPFKIEYKSEIVCKKCNGIAHDEDYKRCPRCNGTGFEP